MFAKLRICLSQLHFFVSFNQTRTVVSTQCRHLLSSSDFNSNPSHRTLNVDFRFAKLRRCFNFIMQKLGYVRIHPAIPDRCYITHLQNTSIESPSAVSRCQRIHTVGVRRKLKRVFAKVRIKLQN